MVRASHKGKIKGRRMGFLLGLFLVLCAGGLIGFRLFRNRGDQGTSIKPHKDYEVGEIICYGQKHEAWKEDRLGSSAYTMGGSGCLTSCIASALSTEHEQKGLGSAVTAGELNRFFTEQNVYNDSGDILWDHLRKALPDGEVYVASSVREEEIEDLLEQGHYPIVKVKVGGYGAGHWVLLVGSEKGEYLCMDPLSENGEVLPLGRHGGTVYRMRCVYWKD